MRVLSASGLNLAVFRVQDPGTGRWTTQDPLGFGGGDANLYRYADADPSNAADRAGTFDDPDPLPPIEILRPPLGPAPLPAPSPSPLFPAGTSPAAIVQWPSNPTLLPSPPADWINNPSVSAAMRAAWNDEIRLGFEQGFWVLWNPSTQVVTITRSGFSQKGRMKGTTHVEFPNDISPFADADRERIKTLPAGLPLTGYCIIGQFHTHITGSNTPSGKDRDSKWPRGPIRVPTYIIAGPVEAVPF
jgi:RHS repeat-associated protein